MLLTAIRIRNFRIYSDLTVSLKKRITVFTGPNGAGKTSVLEAIALLSSIRSFRFGKNEDLIRIGAEQSTLEGRVEEWGFVSKITLNINSHRKQVFLNQKEQRQRRKISGVLPVVVFSPTDAQIVEGGGLERRAFLNHALSNLDFVYADTLRQFQKVLLQRNLLLKRCAKAGSSFSSLERALEVWDPQFVRLGAILMRERRKYLRSLLPVWNDQYQQMSGKKDQLDLVYLFSGQPEVGNIENIEEFLSFGLKESLQKDAIRCTTSIGPHRDEILLTLNGNKIKFYASQGEKRTAVLALRLAEVALFKALQQKDPVLLIDDVSSELDALRRKSLVNLLREGSLQVVMTATELPKDLLKDINDPFEHFELKEIR